MWYHGCMNNTNGITYIAQDGSYGNANGIIILKNSYLPEGFLEELELAPDKREWAFGRLHEVNSKNVVIEHSGVFVTEEQRESLNHQVREFYLGKNYVLN